jgi:hypothetical protein
MALLSVTNLSTSNVVIQDPTGLYGISLQIAGSGSLTNYAIVPAELAAIEPLLIAEATAGNITYTISGNPSVETDLLPDHMTTVLVTPYDAVAGDKDVVTNLTSPGAVSVVLSASSPIGWRVTVVDGKGDAGTNHVTVTVASSGTINGASSNVISSNYGHATYLKVGATAWLSI